MNGSVVRYVVACVLFFFFKQKTAYEMRISDWSSDVCSSDLAPTGAEQPAGGTTTDGTVTDETITDGTTTPEDGAAAGTPVGGIHAIDTAQLPHSLSPWGMFVSADMVVKAVMIGLVIASDRKSVV